MVSYIKWPAEMSCLNLQRPQGSTIFLVLLVPDIFTIASHRDFVYDLVQVVLKRGLFCLPGYVCKYLETFWVVTI